MRIAAQFLLIALACAISCWLLSRLLPPKPTIVSGVAIDWKTGRPVPHIRVVLDRGPNYLGATTTTDALGHFYLRAPFTPEVYFVYAAVAREQNTLMQMRFGQRIVIYRKGEQFGNVTVPVIPPTAVSGHVFGDDGSPIAGCHVAAITRTSTPAQQVGSEAWVAAERNDRKPFLNVESERTDSTGAYRFTRLGADRYYILARCKAPNGHADRLDRWSPMVYPQAASMASGKEVILFPGDRLSGIDFHLHRERTYSLRGEVTLSDGSIPKPGVIYSHDLVVLRSDRGLSSTALGHEDCDWGEVRTFGCSFLSPGTYDLYFSLSPFSPAAEQFEKVTFTVTATPMQPQLRVQLHNLPQLKYSSQQEQTGALDFRRVCETSVNGIPPIWVSFSSERVMSGAACYYMTFFEQTKLSVPPGLYTVAAFQSVFDPPRNDKGSAYLRRFESILASAGVSAKVSAGQTARPMPSLLTRSQMIQMALDSLRHSTGP